MPATGTSESVWKYDLKDWHPDIDLPHEEWCRQLREAGREPEWLSRGRLKD